MIRRRAVLDTKNPPGQIRGYGPDTLQHNIEQWKAYEKSRNNQHFPCGKNCTWRKDGDCCLNH